MQPGIHKTTKGHDVEVDLALAGGRPRVTCHSCEDATLIYQPYMSMDVWRGKLIEFQVKHGAILESTPTLQAARDFARVGDLLRDDQELQELLEQSHAEVVAEGTAEPEPFGSPWGAPDSGGKEPVIMVARPDDPQPEPTPAGEKPISRELIERFNSLTHFPLSWEKENSAFTAETMKEEKYARDRLDSYGVKTIPDDVVKALCRLREARYNLFVASVRAREIAPPWTVTGSANYHKVFRPERAERVIRRGLDDLETARSRLQKVLRRYGPSQVISADDPTAPEQLDEKIRQAERRQELMKTANAVLRRKWTNEQKLEKLWELGLPKSTCEKLLQPDDMKRIGFPQYLLTNNLANINRMRQRLKGLVNERGKDTKEVPFAGGRVVDNAEDNRVQIFFDEKPGAEMIKKLKARGFHWAPSIQAWQRQRTNNARYDAGEIVGVKVA